MKWRIPPLARNWISLVGAAVAAISFFMIVFLFAITVVIRQQASYIGLIIYIILPGIMILGLCCVVLGMIRQMRRSSGKERTVWPRIDLNDGKQRKAFGLFAVGTAVFLFVSALGSYEAFKFTESNRFCGRLCHSVMEPEYTAYRNSAHARVDCVACHVGPGADWYVRSKLSGLIQVYKTLADTYPKPIPAPIENLRPARAICEQCHWPRHSLVNNLKRNVHFRADRDNTRWEIGLNVRIGPDEVGRRGAHWHIQPDTRIEYIATDAQRMQIPWVRYTNLATGEETIYRTDESLKPEDRMVHTMDCLDCHNRPSHPYLSPNDFIDEALLDGRIPSDLPGIKKAAVRACEGRFESLEAAQRSIASSLRDFYRKNETAVLQERTDDLQQAIETVQAAYSENIFPEMNVDWRDYPDHGEHVISPGCFRCHDGKHRTPEGAVIGRDCELCHDIVLQGEAGALERASFGGSLSFRHPVDVGRAWQGGCAQCHQGRLP